MITIEYTWDKNLALKGAKELYDYEFSHSRKRFIGWFFIALVQFGVVGALKHNSYGLLTIGTIAVVYWYNFRWPLREYFIKKTFEKSPFANKKISLVLKEDGIYNDENIQIPKDSIKKTIQLDSGILLYYIGGNIYFPNKAFKNIDEKNKFIKILSN